jgi:hypothetical protein
MQYKFDEENHIHLLDGQPLYGTSSMASVLAKGGLTYWASGLAVSKFGWIHPGDKKKGWTPKSKRLESAFKRWEEICSMDGDEYLSLLDSAYKAHSVKLKDSASEGTDMHAVMEAYVTDCIKNHEGKPFVPDMPNDKLQILVKWSLKNVKKFLASEVHCFSKDLWLGGIVDCIYEDMEGKIVVLDFKSSKEVYISQFWQCIGYAMQLEENGGLTKDGVKILSIDKPVDYVAVLPFGMEKPEVQYNVDMAGGKEAVKAMLTLYKKLN